MVHSQVYFDVLNRLSMTHECDERTDRQTFQEQLLRFTTLHGQISKSFEKCPNDKITEIVVIRKNSFYRAECMQGVIPSVPPSVHPSVKRVN